jgi:thioredoxin reductase (NADPH)
MSVPARPAIMLVEPDLIAREDLADDLRERYGDRYRITAAASAEEAQHAIVRLRLANTPLAVVVSALALGDGGVEGAELLAGLRTDDARVKRVLVTDASEADHAVALIDRIGVDQHLVRPVRPAEHRLYPAIDDVLFDWESRAGDGVPLRVLGHRFAARSFEIKDFLARNLVPYVWLDVDTDPEAARVARALRLPSDPCPTTVVFGDGRSISDPALIDLARALGLTQEATKDTYDLVVIGGGPAGLAGAVYGACEGLSVAIVEDDAPGGQAGSTSRIENYLGFPSGLTGADLAQRALVQAKRFGVEWISARDAVGLRVNDNGTRTVDLSDGTALSARAVLVATGMKWRKLNVSGLDSLLNAGVYYGSAPDDAVSCAGEDVFMVGAGNSAGQAALHFAEHAESVTMLVRDSSLRGGVLSSYLADRIEAHPKITIRCDTEVAEAHGQGRLSGLTLRNNRTRASDFARADALYLMIGVKPCTEWIERVVALDERGFVLTGTDVKEAAGRAPVLWSPGRDPLLTETSVPGVFAAGDVRAGTVKRVGSAVGQGAVAIAAITEYLKEHIAEAR